MANPDRITNLIIPDVTQEVQLPSGVELFTIGKIVPVLPDQTVRPPENRRQRKHGTQTPETNGPIVNRNHFAVKESRRSLEKRARIKHGQA